MPSLNDGDEDNGGADAAFHSVDEFDRCMTQIRFLVQYRMHSAPSLTTL